MKTIKDFKKQKFTHKRYILFGCSEYYPSGDLSDVQGSFGDLEGAAKAYQECTYEFKLIYDRIEDIGYTLVL